jgi:hypothetical protein
MSMKTTTLLAAAILIALVLVGLFWGRNRREPTPGQEAAREVRVFLNTIRTDRWPNAYNVLDEEVRERVAIDSFRQTVEAHPALADFESFEPSSVEDPLEVRGVLRGAGRDHDLVVRYAPDGTHIRDIVLDGRSLLGD